MEDALEVVPQTCFRVEAARSAFEVLDPDLEVGVGLGEEVEAHEWPLPSLPLRLCWVEVVHPNPLILSRPSWVVAVAA